ncbi:g8329 [Coccomyxa viridis]|uniref:G8329 protein n=1 Tax=Coccomyxa viridis TaxID=1274662 RepID=A0ABP1G039_9CHLO
MNAKGGLTTNAEADGSTDRRHLSGSASSGVSAQGLGEIEMSGMGGGSSIASSSVPSGLTSPVNSSTTGGINSIAAAPAVPSTNGDQGNASSAVAPGPKSGDNTGNFNGVNDSGAAAGAPGGQASSGLPNEEGPSRLQAPPVVLATRNTAETLPTSSVAANPEQQPSPDDNNTVRVVPVRFHDQGWEIGVYAAVLAVFGLWWAWYAVTTIAIKGFY